MARSQSDENSSSAIPVATPVRIRNEWPDQVGVAQSFPQSAQRSTPLSAPSTPQRPTPASPSVSRNPLERHWSEYIVEDDSSEFPIGWEQRRTAVGAIYYVDHIHRRTTFEDPRIAHRKKRIQEAQAHEATLPKYKRNLRRKLLRLRDLFKHRMLPATNAQGNTAQPPRADIVVSRRSVFEDSYQAIMKIPPEQFAGKLSIEFVGEAALDYGGVAREWFYLLSKEMLNPYYGLFQHSSGDYLLEVNPNSSINPDHLSYFRFIGRVLGLAVQHGHYVDGAFVMPLYKLLLGRSISLDDMEKVSRSFFSSELTFVTIFFYCFFHLIFFCLLAKPFQRLLFIFPRSMKLFSTACNGCWKMTSRASWRTRLPTSMKPLGK